MEDFITFKSFDNDKEESPIAKAMETLIEKVIEPIMPKALPKEIELTLNSRLGDEYTAYYFYRNAANWCKGVNYPKAAAFFEKEAAGELEHALKIQDYLTQWNLYPDIPAVETGRAFLGLVDLINQAYELEWNLLQKYSNDQKEIFRDHPATFNFIQEYVDIQVGEVSEYSDLLNALQLIDVSSKLDLLVFEDRYFG
jgi:ferritin